MPRPSASEYGSNFGNYIQLVAEEDILATMRSQGEEMVGFLRMVDEIEGNQRHPPFTWSVKEVVGHVTDTERIFGYRALRFARGDETPLAGFDENNFAKAGDFDRCSLASLVREFEHLRLSHLEMFQNLPEPAWLRTEIASETRLTVRARWRMRSSGYAASLRHSPPPAGRVCRMTCSSAAWPVRTLARIQGAIFLSQLMNAQKNRREQVKEAEKKKRTDHPALRTPEGSPKPATIRAMTLGERVPATEPTAFMARKPSPKMIPR
ncbi:MAG: DinB family protein [Planctomycetota bacterium]